jgi:hypothetical protein
MRCKAQMDSRAPPALMAFLDRRDHLRRKHKKATMAFAEVQMVGREFQGIQVSKAAQEA